MSTGVPGQAQVEELGVRVPVPTRVEGSARGREWYDSLQGLRAVAMTLVFGYHFLTMTLGERRFVYHPVGSLGTDIFFALAGALAYRSLIREPITYWSYMKRRVWRIYPVYLIVFGVYVGLELVLRTGRMPLPVNLEVAGQYLSDLLLVTALRGGWPILDVTWALHFIFAFYLVSPLVVWPLRRLPPQWRPLVLVGLWVVGVLVSEKTGWYPLRVTLLMAGPLVWAARRMRHTNWIEVAVAVSGVVVRMWGRSPEVQFLGTVMAVPAIVSLALAEDGWLGHLLRWRPLAWVGGRSYSFYLLHSLPLLALGAFGPKNLPVWGAGLAAVGGYGVSVGLAAVMYRYVEEPMSRKGR